MDSSASSNRGIKLNINGMGFRSNSYLLDGANMRGYAGTATVSAADSTLGVETIREFRVVTNSFSADYGRAMGGIINLATKSGTNELHGSAFEFFRDSAMDARNFFDAARPAAVHAPSVRRRSVGGPLRREQDLLSSAGRAAAGGSGRHEHHGCADRRRARAWRRQPLASGRTSICIRCRTDATWEAASDIRL